MHHLKTSKRETFTQKEMLFYPQEFILMLYFVFLTDKRTSKAQEGFVLLRGWGQEFERDQ